ncbi:MAG: SDR family NAD(P)-dependent oxidoreductase, partial [Acidobacteriota bacterium]
MNEKVAVITGASSGIGRATALTFVRGGATVIAVGRSNGELGTLRDEARGAPGTVRIHLADLSEISQIDRL